MSKLALVSLCSFLLFAPSKNLKADDASDESIIVSQKQRLGKSNVQVELQESPQGAIFVVTGLSKLELLREMTSSQLLEAMAVRVHVVNGDTTTPPLLGTHSVNASDLRFSCRFPLSPAVKYQVELSSSLVDSAAVERVVHFSSQPREPIAAAKVSAVYPSASLLPENVLKFYIHFSAPMSRGEAYERIHLFQGDYEVESPFLELSDELWDTEQKRFTLLVHPGRIKRGLKPREDVGLPMNDGKDYTLRIDAAWMSADRQPLASPFVKKFRVVSADATQPNPNQWKLVSPKVDSRQPVILSLDEPLDHAMLNRVIQVRDHSNAILMGQVTIGEGETAWAFEPNEPWKSGAYTIALATNLEDLAGNSLARPFETKEETDSNVSVLNQKAMTELSIPFVVK